jgi:UDP-2,3-diacylglucosamine pyrophosphatase LpxH
VGRLLTASGVQTCPARVPTHKEKSFEERKKEEKEKRKRKRKGKGKRKEKEKKKEKEKERKKTKENLFGGVCGHIHHKEPPHNLDKKRMLRCVHTRYKCATQPLAFGHVPV